MRKDRMGNCVSCTERPKSINQEGEIKFNCQSTQNSTEHISSRTISENPGIELNRIELNNSCGSELRTLSNISASSSNGSRIISNTSISMQQIQQETIENQSSITPSNSVKSQKSEKKNFYSRIPPLGRVGSTEKKNSNGVSIIKDNNNQYSESKIVALYEIYKDQVEDFVLAEGVERLCKDLDLKPEDFKILLLAWKFHAKTMCRFSRDEWIDGMAELKVDTIPGIQGKLTELESEVLNDRSKFRELYKFTFSFGLESDVGQRILPIEMAISLWKIVFNGQEPMLLKDWIEFLENIDKTLQNNTSNNSSNTLTGTSIGNYSNIGIPRDTWNMFLHFIDTVGNDLMSYDDTEAWPSLLDDFVEYQIEKIHKT